MDENSENTKPDPNSLSVSKKNQASESVSYYVDQLAMALGQVIEPERELLYVKALEDLTANQLAFGFSQTLRLWKPEFGRTFPAPAEIREWAQQWRPQEAKVKALLDRPDKPDPDETPEARAQNARSIINEIRKKLGNGAISMESGNLPGKEPK